MTRGPTSAMAWPQDVAHQRPYLPHRGARHLRPGHRRHPGGPQGRARRPQRLGQDHAAAPHRRRDRARRRRHPHPAVDPHRLGGAGGAGRARKPDRLRAGRRHGAGATCSPRRRPRTTRPASPISTSASPTSTRTPPPPGPRASSPASASTRRPSSAPAREYSGGWRMRVALAAMLFREPDLLLLDEPTNYLDLEGTLWLEEYLADYPHTVLIVSHDRDLLNRSVGAILHLSQGKLTLYTGGYDQFEEARRERQRLDLKLKKKQDDERRHIEAFIARFKAKASKAAQAQSRVKALARMQPIAEAIEERIAPVPDRQSGEGLREPADPARGRGSRLRRGPAGAAGSGSATGCRRPHRPARRQRQRQEHLRQADRRPPPGHGRQALRPRQDRRRLFRPAPDGRPARRHDALPAHARADAGGDGGAAARPARHARLRRRQGRYKGREALRRREGAPAVGARHLPRRAPADPRRADQPPRRRRARGAGAFAQRLRGRRDPDHATTGI